MLKALYGAISSHLDQLCVKIGDPKKQKQIVKHYFELQAYWNISQEIRRLLDAERAHHASDGD